MAVTRRRFLTCVAAGGGGSLAYEAMTALGLLAAPSQTSFNLAGRVSGVGVVILGAGLSGMTAAYELGKAGFDCRVLEMHALASDSAQNLRVGCGPQSVAPSATKPRWNVPSLKKFSTRPLRPPASTEYVVGPS